MVERRDVSEHAHPPHRIGSGRLFDGVARLLQDVSGLAIMTLRCVYRTEIYEKVGASKRIASFGPGEELQRLLEHLFGFRIEALIIQRNAERLPKDDSVRWIGRLRLRQ